MNVDIILDLNMHMTDIIPDSDSYRFMTQTQYPHIIHISQHIPTLELQFITDASIKVLGYCYCEKMDLRLYKFDFNPFANAVLEQFSTYFFMFAF